MLSPWRSITRRCTTCIRLQCSSEDFWKSMSFVYAALFNFFADWRCKWYRVIENDRKCDCVRVVTLDVLCHLFTAILKEQISEKVPGKYHNKLWLRTIISCKRIKQKPTLIQITRYLTLKYSVIQTKLTHWGRFCNKRNTKHRNHAYDLFDNF